MIGPLQQQEDMVATLLGEKLIEAGMVPRDVELRRALAKFQNNGGTYERGLSLLNAAYGKGGEGQSVTADKGHVTRADASRTTEGKGQSVTAYKASDALPDPSTQRNGVGQKKNAVQANRSSPRPVPPRYIHAAKISAKAAAISVLDTWKVRNGTALGDVTFGELEGIRFENAREASIIRQIQKHCHAAPDVKVRDAINVETLQRIIQRAAEVADAA